MSLFDSRRARIVRALIVSNLACVVFFGMRVAIARNFDYWYLFWNLLLAWIPVPISVILVKVLHRKTWWEPLPIILTLLWLGFLPNSFYLITDLIHLHSTGDVGLLFDVTFFMSFIWNGIIAGILSMVIVHREINRRQGEFIGGLLVGIVVLLASFAIYLGRSLRWNTWDVVVNPAGVLFDVGERFINPLAHPQVISTTLTFTILVGVMYMVVWSFVGLLYEQKSSKRSK